MRRFEDHDSFGGTVTGDRRDFGNHEPFLTESVGDPKRFGETARQVPGRRHDDHVRDALLDAELKVPLALVARVHTFQIEHGALGQVSLHRRLVVADDLPNLGGALFGGLEGVLPLLETFTLAGAGREDDHLGLIVHRNFDRHGAATVERGARLGAPHNLLPLPAVQVGLEMAAMQKHGNFPNPGHCLSCNLRSDHF